MVKLASGNITDKYFSLQSEHMGTCRIRVIVCNVSIDLTGHVLASFLGAYGRVEELTPLKVNSRTAYSDCSFKIRLKRDSF